MKHSKLLVLGLVAIGLILCGIGFATSSGAALEQGQQYIGSDWSVYIPSVSVISPFSLTDTFGNYLISESGIETNTLSTKTSLDLWDMLFGYSTTPFTKIFGSSLFITLILIFYFISIWLRSNNLSLVTICMGLVLSVVGSELCEEYRVFFILAMIIGFAGIFWRLFFSKRS